MEKGLMTTVIKRNGKKEQYDVTKIRKVINWACEGTNINPVQLESSLDTVIVDGVRTKDIHKNLTLNAKTFITIEEPQWRDVAGKLLMQNIWKQAFLTREGVCYGDCDNYIQFVKMMVSKGKYVDIFEYVSEERIREIFPTVGFDIQKDFLYDYAGAQQLEKKYLIDEELPQEMYLTIALILGSRIEKMIGKPLYREIYEAISELKISLATPILINLRRPNGNLSSCFTLALDDSLKSIMENLTTASFISKNAGGIGVDVSNVRARGSMIKGIYGCSNGVTPWIKLFNDVANACNQLNARKGAITVALCVWHYDINEFLEIGVEEGDLRLKSFDVFPQVLLNDVFMEQVECKGDWYVFCPHEVKQTYNIDLTDLWGNKFREAYDFLVSKLHTLKIWKKHNAFDIFKRIMQVQIETGLPYLTFKDTVNKYNPNQKSGVIRNGNLCVAPETRILTDKGHVEIQELAGQTANLWNGQEWSMSKVFKTGDNQKIIKVKLSNGSEIECTEYHKFPVQKKYRDKNFVLVEARDLTKGDKLIKYDLPIIENEDDKELDYAYTQGFFSGDGSLGYKGHPEIDLYHEKRELVGFIDVRNKTQGSKYYSRELNELAIYEDDKQNRTVCKLPKDIKPKNFVPLTGYTVQSRLSWLAGLFDADGCVVTVDDNQSLQLTSVDFEFINNVRLLLQTLGVDSKVTNGMSAGMRLMPDGNGGLKKYNCKEAKRILISSNGLYKLAKLGFVTNRLKWTVKKPQRDARRFIQVLEIVDEGRTASTYCFTEPKRNLGMFEGVLLGNCQESYSNTAPDSEIHVCNLDALNLANITDIRDIEWYATLATFILDALIDITVVPTELGAYHNQKYRTIGVGVLGLADHLAANDYNFTTGKEYIGELFEEIAYQVTSASMEICKHGNKPFEAFEDSLWAEGKMIGKPLEWFEQHASKPERWVHLAEDISRYGIRNSQCTALMPTTSTSLLQGCTAAFLPPYDLYITDDNTNTAPVMPKYIETKYNYYQANLHFNQRELVDIVATEIQPWIDTGISFELTFDLNSPDFSAPFLRDCIMDAWKKDIKTIYYIRTEAIEEAKCDSCAG